MTERDPNTRRFVRRNPREHLYANFAIDYETGCWNWTASLFGAGYGYFCSRDLCKKAMAASRASWLLHKGPLGRWDFVCHSCDNPKCVNPDHLFVGAPKANVHDMMNKDRISWGEGRPAAKLNETAVIAIREERARGDTYQAIANRYGVYKTCIFKVCKGESWRRVA